MGVRKKFALGLGIVLTVVGIWGFFQSQILGLFGVNALHNVLHLVAGGFGIYVGTKGEGPGYTASIGYIGLGLFVLGYIPGVDTLLANLINLDTADNFLHLGIGAVTLAVHYLTD